jgi:hypothetical protein
VCGEQVVEQYSRLGLAKDVYVIRIFDEKPSNKEVQTKSMTYTSLARPNLEYCSTTCSPHMTYTSLARPNLEYCSTMCASQVMLVEMVTVGEVPDWSIENTVISKENSWDMIYKHKKEKGYQDRHNHLFTTHDIYILS